MTTTLPKIQFRDPRNAIGLHADRLKLVLDATKDDIDFDIDSRRAVLWAYEVGRDFAKSPRSVLQGAYRNGTANFFQRVRACDHQISQHPADWINWGSTRCYRVAAYQKLGRDITGIILAVMERTGLTWWERHTCPDKRTGLSTWDINWSHFHMSSLGDVVDAEQLAQLELDWRYRDVTDRNRRGPNIKAAFEAAWLVGEHQLAIAIVTRKG